MRGTEGWDWKDRGGRLVHAPAWRLDQLFGVTPDRHLSDIILNTPSVGDTTAYMIQAANGNAEKYRACSRLQRQPTSFNALLPLLATMAFQQIF